MSVHPCFLVGSLFVGTKICNRLFKVSNPPCNGVVDFNIMSSTYQEYRQYNFRNMSRRHRNMSQRHSRQQHSHSKRGKLGEKDISYKGMILLAMKCGKLFPVNLHDLHGLGSGWVQKSVTRYFVLSNSPHKMNNCT